MNRWQPAAWTALGAGVMVLGLYGAGAIRGTGAAPAPSADEGDAQPSKDAKPALTDPGDLARLGVKTAAVGTIATSQTNDGFARGLDAGPLAAIVADIDAARVAADASRAEAARLDILYRQDVSASRRSVETARAQAQADAFKARLAEQRVGLEYGTGLARLGAGGVRHLVAEIVNGRAALVRIDIPDAALAAGSIVEIGEPGASFGARVLGPAAAADVKLQSAGVLAVVRGPLARQAQAGRVLPARAATGVTRAGVLVPRDAIVRFQSRMWVFRKTGKAFERVALEDPQPLREGWMVTNGVKAGDVIAISGAVGLLAIDARGAVSDAEE